MDTDSSPITPPRPHRLEPDETLCFLHIPKTAGLTMRHILDTYFGYSEVCPADSYSSLAPFTRDQLAQFRLLRGHFWRNIGELLPSTPVFMTILRDPVERTLSQYEYVRSEPGNGQLYDRVKGMTLGEYLQDEYMRECTLRNLQTRFLAPSRQPSDPYEIAPIEHLGIDQAKANLESCHFVGVTERFDDAVKLLAYTFHWRPTRQFAVRNASRKRLARSSLPPRLVDEILRLNEDDVKLYEFGKTLFGRRFAAMMDELLDDHFDRHDAVTARRQSSVVLVPFGKPVNGEGWYPSEIDGIGNMFRWTGPGATSFIDVALLPGTDSEIRFQVTERINQEVFDSLAVLVNGTPISLTIDETESGAVLSGLIPGTLTAAAYTRITFRLKETRTPADITNGKNLDDRMLGIALAWLEITPARTPTESPSTIGPADTALSRVAEEPAT